MGLMLRGGAVMGVSLVVMVLGGWLLYGSVQVFSRSFRIGSTPATPPPIAPPPSAPPGPVAPGTSPRP